MKTAATPQSLVLKKERIYNLATESTGSKAQKSGWPCGWLTITQ